MNLLEVEGLAAGYGQSQVLFDIGLAVAPGQCVTLLGRNGMGKTTTIKTIMGLLRPWGGVVRWKGRAVQGRPPHAMARLGLGLVPEGRQVQLRQPAVRRRAADAGHWTCSDDQP